MNPHLDIKKRGLFNLPFLIVLGSVFLLILFIAYFFYGLQPSVAVEDMKLFKIVKGEGLKDISAHLSQQSLIKSISVFKFYSLISGKAQKFQPGSYELSSSMSIPEIIRILTVGGKNEVSVIIPEGSTLKDTENILSKAGVIQPKTLTNYSFKILAAEYPFLSEAVSLEGFLFPDTYRFSINSSPEDVVRKMIDNFEIKAWPILKDSKSWYDFLILASYLEREVPGFDDRQIVAGILLKRLKSEMPLQVDATVSYVKCGGLLMECSNLIVTKKDLSLASVYNTYQKLGLSPTPISNPGQSAIKAAVSSRATPYWYYLSAAKTKETIFSKTLEQHNLNIIKYL